MFLDDVSWAARDMVSIWGSPFRASTDDWLRVAAVLGASAAVSPLDDEVDRWALRNRDRGVLDAIRPVRRGGDFYSLNKATPYVAGAYVVGLAIKHRGLRDGIMGCAAAYGTNTISRHQVIYRLIGRDRPDTVRRRAEGTVGPPAQHGDQYRFSFPSDGWGAHSFPGGHVATMTTCATFLSSRFDMGYVEPALGVLVTAMGVGRIADRGHWLSDQMVGVAFGYAIGREVARRQLRRLDAEKGMATTSSGALHEPFARPAALGGVDLGWRITY
jgi:membrane-associated phospholipid phosphatase